MSYALTDAENERITAINASLKRWRIVHRPLTDDFQPAKKAFALFSRGGEQVSRYGSIDTAERAARIMETW